MDFSGKKFFKKTTYNINGKEYHSLEEVPEEFRRLLEDKDGDGCPDWIQSQVGQTGGYVSRAGFEMTTVNGVTTYKVGDREYRSLDEMPLEHRTLFEDRDGDGIPDAFGKPGPPSTAFEDNAASYRDGPDELQVPLLDLNFRADDGSSAIKIIGIIVCVLIVALAGVAVFLYRG